MRAEGHLRFYHPELNQMATSFRFFRTEGRTEGEHATMGHGSSFHIKLSTLGKISIIFKILCMEQFRRAFRSTGRQNRWIDFRKAPFIKKFISGANDFVTNLQDRPLFARAEPEVTVVH